MTRSGKYVQGGSIALVAWTLVLGACSTQTSEMNDLQRENEERQALIEAMKRHPAFNEAENAAATGAPINVPVTVPPTPKGDDHHEHMQPEPK